MIDIKHLSHIYKLRGIKTKALDDITLKVEKGEIFGLLGTNGAGKSTMIKILTTLLYPTSGEAKIDGLDIRKEAKKVRSRVGVVMGQKIIYGGMTGRDNLRFFGNIYDVQNLEHKINELAHFFELEDKIDTLVEGYSSGMRMKLAIMRGLINDPQILCLDEPTLGLDPNMQLKIRKKIKELQMLGKTIILTTHYMLEAEELCDRIGILKKGSLKAIDTPQALRKKMPGKNILEIKFKNPHIADKFKQDYILTKDPTLLMIPIINSDHLNRALKEIMSNGFYIEDIKLVEPSLEKVFSYFTE